MCVASRGNIIVAHSTRQNTQSKLPDQKAINLHVDNFERLLVAKWFVVERLAMSGRPNLEILLDTQSKSGVVSPTPERQHGVGRVAQQHVPVGPGPAKGSDATITSTIDVRLNLEEARIGSTKVPGRRPDPTGLSPRPVSESTAHLIAGRPDHQQRSLFAFDAP